MVVCHNGVVSLLIWMLLVAATSAYALALPTIIALPQSPNASFPFVQHSGVKTVDSRFSALFQDGKEDLSEKSVYMSVLKTLADMSRHDFNYRCPGGRWSFSEYRDIEIVVEPAITSGTEFQWRFAIWGLYFAVRRVHYSNFVNCRTMLLWQGVQGTETVGFVYIQKSPTSTAAISGSSAFAQPGSDLSPSPNISLSGDDANITFDGANISRLFSQENINLAIDVTGGRLSKWGAFFPIYSAIVALASFDQKMPIPGIVTRDPQSNAKLNIEHWAEPRTVPPYFVPRTAIVGLARIPKYMYQNNRFNEVRFVFEVDTKPVGYGYIRKQAIPTPLRGIKGTESTSTTLTADSSIQTNLAASLVSIAGSTGATSFPACVEKSLNCIGYI